MAFQPLFIRGWKQLSAYIMSLFKEPLGYGSVDATAVEVGVQPLGLQRHHVYECEAISLFF